MTRHGPRPPERWLRRTGPVLLLAATAACGPGEVDGCKRIGSRFDHWRAELEASLNAEAISETEWSCKLDALRELDREVTERCRSEPMTGTALLEGRDRRYAACGAGGAG